jgi:hypothetical protein
MQVRLLLKRLEGVQTVKSVATILGVPIKKAIYYIHRLRKQGYVKTARASDGSRVYSISFENKFGGVSYEELLNKASPIKISTAAIHLVYGKTPSPEEIIIHAIKTKSLRTILAALVFFRKPIDWETMYRLAKKNYCERQVGALYDVAKTVMRVRHMDKRFRTFSLPKPEYEFQYSIPGLKSKDFSVIEQRWKIYLPFNKKDLEAYQ